MNTTKPVRSKRAMHGFGFTGMMLLLGVILTAIVFFDRLTFFAAADQTLVIPITAYALDDSADTDTDSAASADIRGESENSLSNSTEQNSLPDSQEQDNSSPVPEQNNVSSAPEPNGFSQGVPGFEVSDHQKIWSSETEVEIFRVSYVNGENQVTVAGNGDKLLAPGTGNSYSFRLSNTGDTAIDYAMTLEARFSHEDMPVPVQARLSDYQGNYFAGSETEWSPIMELNGIGDTGVLGANHYSSYTLTWQWPFEGDDVYDTFLGDTAVQEDITLTIVIRITASADDNPNASGGIPETGDNFHMTLWLLLLAASFGCMVIVLSIRRRGSQT